MYFAAKKSKVEACPNQHGRARSYRRPLGQFETTTAETAGAESTAETAPSTSPAYF